MWTEDESLREEFFLEPDASKAVSTGMEDGKLGF